MLPSIFWLTGTISLAAYLLGSGSQRFKSLLDVVTCAVKQGFCQLMELVLGWFIPLWEDALEFLPEPPEQMGAMIVELCSYLGPVKYWMNWHELAGFLWVYSGWKLLILTVRVVKRWIPTMG